MNVTPHPSESSDQSALSALYWRDEILQVLYWLRGEGISHSVGAEELSPFITADADLLRAHLARMVDEGYLIALPSADELRPEREEGAMGVRGEAARRYTLTERGRKDGGKLFQEEFEGLTNQAHGECNNPNCACHTLGPEACESRQHVH